MKKNFLKYFIYLITLIVLISITIYSLPTNKYNWVKNLKESVPQKYKKKFKNSVFIIPELYKKNARLKNEVKILKEQIELNTSELNLLSSQINGIKVNDTNFIITKKKIPFSKTVNYGDGKPVSYLAQYKDKIIFVSGYGKILFSKPKNFLPNSEIKYNEIKNNLRKKITDNAFWDLDSSIIVKDKTGWNNNLSNGVSVKGILIHENIIYLAYLREIKEKCYATSILSAKMNLTYLEFNDFYVPNDCISPLDTEFLPHAAGGRMVVYKDNKILLTVGDFSHFMIAQDDNLNFGKIVSIDIKTKKYKYFSKGHRNPQGLLYLKEKDVILSTEHGPKGGDEINKIIENQNYGWPIASYGIIYGHELKKLGPTFEEHAPNGFKEPSFYWKINPGIGQIIEVPISFSENLKDHFLITSLSGSLDRNDQHMGKSLYIVKFNNDYEKVISIERLFVGERIRDIIYSEDLNGFLIAMENSSSIGLVRNKNIN